MPDWVLFAVPVLAIAARGVLVLFNHRVATQVLPPAERDSDGHRAIILPLAGFSFTALLALVVLDAKRILELRIPILLLLLSFLGFYFTLNLQSYKAIRWHDQMGTALKEAASGWLLLSVVSIVNQSSSPVCFQLAVSLLSLAVWLFDFGVRYKIDFGYYHALEKTL